MKKVYVGTILLLALLGFGLQPTKGTAVPVSLAVLHSLPATLGPFHEIDNNDAELIASPAYTDGSQGLQRDYRDNSGQELNLYVAPQTIGQHVPLFCYRYTGYSILSETQRSLPGYPQLRFNRLVVRETATNTVSTCAYYWKTATGVFTPTPYHALGMIAVRWAEHQQGILVLVCAKSLSAHSPEAEPAIEELLRSSYPDIARLYPAVFQNTAIR